MNDKKIEESNESYCSEYPSGKKMINKYNKYALIANDRIIETVLAK